MLAEPRRPRVGPIAVRARVDICPRPGEMQSININTTTLPARQSECVTLFLFHFSSLSLSCGCALIALASWPARSVRSRGPRRAGYIVAVYDPLSPSQDVGSSNEDGSKVFLLPTYRSPLHDESPMSPRDARARIKDEGAAFGAGRGAMGTERMADVGEIRQL